MKAYLPRKTYNWPWPNKHYEKEVTNPRIDTQGHPASITPGLAAQAGPGQ